MHILFNVAGDVEIYDVLHVGDVEAAGSNCRGNQERSPSRLETVQCSFPIGLTTVAMDTSHGVTL